MNILKTLHNRWRDLFRKRRVAMLNATDNTEEWHIHLSPANLFAGAAAAVLLLFIAVLSLMAYTPVLEFLPGYRTAADRSRESVVQNILRLDSMERVMNDMMTYNENIALILEGKTPVARTIATTDSTRRSKVLVMPSPEDSILRTQMESRGPYALAGSTATSRRQVREALELVTPIEGIITDRFDLKAGRFGVRIAVAATDPVRVIDDGTTLLSLWTPDEGYVVGVLHANNLLSLYKHMSRSLVSTGQTIRAGEVAGYSAEGQDGKIDLFEFELWNNGKPVDPEGYIVF